MDFNNAAFDYSATKPDMIIAPVQLENKPGFSGRFRELEFLSLAGSDCRDSRGRISGNVQRGQSGLYKGSIPQTFRKSS